MAGSLFFIIEELLDYILELQQCLQWSNEEAFLFMEFQQIEGNACGAETFFTSLFRAIRSKSKLTGKLLARLTFCESLPNKTLGS